MLLAICMIASAFSASALTALADEPLRALQDMYPEGLNAIPDPIDPQTWKLQKDMTWDEYLPNPVVDWNSPDRDVVPANRILSGALVLVDFIDKPFNITMPQHSELFTNPQNAVPVNRNAELIDNDKPPIWSNFKKDPLDPSKILAGTGGVAEFYALFLNKAIMDTGNPAYNHGATIDNYWREASAGQWNITLETHGPFQLPYPQIVYSSYWGSAYNTVYNQILTAYGHQLINDRPPGSSPLARRTIASDINPILTAAGAPLGDYDFIFFVHSGYDESGVWEEFGEMMFPTRWDVPDRYGLTESVLNRMRSLEGTNVGNLGDVAALANHPAITAWEELRNQNIGPTESTITEYEKSLGLVTNRNSQNWAKSRYGPDPWTSYYSVSGIWSHKTTATFDISPAKQVELVERGEIAIGTTSRRRDISVQGENDGMATFAHEFGHIVGFTDNLADIYGIPPERVPSSFWDIMGPSFHGPGGQHTRWMTPPTNGGSVPGLMMLRSKLHNLTGRNAAGQTVSENRFAVETQIHDISDADLRSPTGGPWVGEIYPRLIPTGDRWEAFGTKDWKSGIRVSGFTQAQPRGDFSDGTNWKDYVDLMWDPAAKTYVLPDSDIGKWDSANRLNIPYTMYTLEAVQRASYDSFNQDSGILLAIATNSEIAMHTFTISAHKEPFKIVDYYKPNRVLEPPEQFGGQAALDAGYVAYIPEELRAENGEYYLYPSHIQQLGTALFHAGVHNNPEYGNKYGYGGQAGDVVNEFVDPFNEFHFYVLNKTVLPQTKTREEGPNIYGDTFSYEIGIRSTADTAMKVGGNLEVNAVEVLKARPDKVAVQYFEITNTGDNIDIIRIAADNNLGWNTTILNNLYAIGAGETITVPVYVQLPASFRAVDVRGQKITLAASSETNGEKAGSAAASVSDLVSYNYEVYLHTTQTSYSPGDTILVDVMLQGDINFTLAETKIAYDMELLEYAGYENLSGWMNQVSRGDPNLVTLRNVPHINMNTGASCITPVKLITLKFKVKDTLLANFTETTLSFETAHVYSTPETAEPATASGEALTLALHK